MSSTPSAKIKTSDKFYASGATTVFASQVDQRFSYSMYIPAGRSERDELPLVVVMHGTGRTANKYRDQMASFCEEHGVAVLCPLFPAGIIDPDDLHNFKFIEYKGIRFDQLLFSMIEEAAQRAPIGTERFMLHGFSGGGQFAQRMLLMHPDRLNAVSIGAAGRYTLIDDETDWWLGTRDLQQRFGVTVDPVRISRVPVQLLVGELDVETWETMDRSGSNWVDGLEKQGATRGERMEHFQRNLAEHGIESRLEVMPGVAHDGAAALEYAAAFFSSLLNSARLDQR